MIGKATKRTLVIACLVALFLLGALYLNTYYKDKSGPVMTYRPITQEDIKSDPLLWPKYRSEKYGFEIAYPPDRYTQGDLDLPNTIRFTTGKPGQSIVLKIATLKDYLGNMESPVYYYDKRSQEMIGYDTVSKTNEVSRLKPNIFGDKWIGFDLDGEFTVITNKENDFILDFDLQNDSSLFHEKMTNSLKFFKPTFQ